MRRVRRILGAGIVLVAAAGLGSGVPGSPAGAALSFRAIASADAVRVAVTVPNFPVTSSVVDTGLYSAEAVVTSNNTSQAFASNPYPGEGVVSLPGTLAGFGVPGIPAYPLYAASVHPSTPHAQVGDGPFRLVADSTETKSEATASSGVSGDQNIGSAVTTASVQVVEDGAVLSHAQTRVDAFAAEGVRIGSVVSSATAKLLPDGKLERSSNLEVAGLAVNDVAVRLTKDGLVAADQTVPLDAAAINDALAQAGVSIAFIAPEETANGVIGAAIRITSAVEVPGSGITNVSLTLGRSLAVIDSAGEPDDVLADLPADGLASEAPTPSSETSSDATPPAQAAPAAAEPETGTLDSVGAAFAGDTSGATSASDFSTTTGDFSSASGGSALTSSSGGYDFGGPAAEAEMPLELGAPGETLPSGAPPSVDPSVSAAPASLSADDASRFFLLLVAGAAAVVVLSQVLGLFGVRLR